MRERERGERERDRERETERVAHAACSAHVADKASVCFRKMARSMVAHMALAATACSENAENGSSPRVRRHAENIIVLCASLATLIGKFLNLLILIE